VTGAETKGPEMIEVKSITDGTLALKVSFSKACLTGESIWCDISVANKGQKNVSYEHISDYRDFIIHVADAAGQPLPLTRFGNTVIAGNSGELKKVTIKFLAPGENLFRHYNLARLFDLTVAGKYTLTISREIDDQSEKHVLKVESIEFTVSEPNV
jgi:hypothetical protein